MHQDQRRQSDIDVWVFDADIDTKCHTDWPLALVTLSPAARMLAELINMLNVNIRLCLSMQACSNGWWTVSTQLCQLARRRQRPR